MDPAEQSPLNPHRMTRLELQRRISALRQSDLPSYGKTERERELETVNDELETYRIELEVQNHELIESRRAIEQAHERYLSLYDFAPVTYVSLDRTGLIRELNLTGAALLGGERQKLLNRSLIAWISDPDRPKFREHLRLLCEPGSTHSILLSLSTPDRHKIPVQLLSTCVEDHDGGLLLLRTTITDLTEQQELVERLEAERILREKFVSELAHDLRSPIAAARIGAQMIEMDSGAAEANKIRAGQILKSVDRMERMIRDLLDANRIQAGQCLHLDLADCDLTALSGAAAEDLTLMYGNRIRLDAPDCLTGFWDAKALRRVIENLVSNAVKYGAPDTPISISIHDRHNWTFLSVHNEGEPISAADQATLFRPFRRTDSARRSGQKGWGIGLTLVRGVAEAHGGTATVKSAPGEGTTFTIRVPRDPRLRSNLLH